MRFGPRLGIQHKMLSFLFIALLPLALLACIAVQENVERSKQRVYAEGKDVAEIARYTVDDFIISTQSLLITLAQLPSVKSRDAEGANLLFSKILPVHSGLNNIFATNTEGTVYASSIPDAIGSVTLMGRPYFHDVIASGKPVVSDRIIGRYTLQPTVAILVPVYDDSGKLIGTVGAGVSLKELRERLVGIKEAKEATIYLVDSQGFVLAHPNFSRVNDATVLIDLPPVRRALRKETGAVEHYGSMENESLLSAYAPIRVADWAVVVSYPTSVVYAPLQETLIRNLLILGLAVSLSAGLILLVSRRFAQSLQQLNKRAKAAAISNYLPDFELNNPDELQQLTKALDLLSGSLSRNTFELAEAKADIGSKVQQLKQALARVNESREEERKRIARDLHDGVAQLVLDTLFQVREANRLVSIDKRLTIDKLQVVQGLLKQTMAEMERAVFDLHPHRIDEEGLVPILNRYCARFREVNGITCEFLVQGMIERLSPEVEITIYRVAQEALNNVRKHSGATNATVTLGFGAYSVEMSVRDNGRGFERTNAPVTRSGLGLLGMEERAQSVGGRVEVISKRGLGTEIKLYVPLESESADGAVRQAMPVFVNAERFAGQET